MNEPTKKEPGFIASLFKAGTNSVRENYARRLGRAYARGYTAARSDVANGVQAPRADSNPYVDDNGQPRYDAETGDVILPEV